MVDLSGFAELEAAKSLLLDALSHSVADDDLLPALQQLESFRNSLWQADVLLIRQIERSTLTAKYCVSSVEKLVAQALRISYGDARRRVRVAAAVGPRHSMLGATLPAARPEVAAALAAGEVGPLAIDLVDRTLVRIELVAPAEVAATESLLVSYARSFEPTELSRICDRVLDHLDPDGSLPRDQLQRDRRELYFGRCRDGMVKVEGRLTAAAGARVKAVLGPLSAPRPSVEAGPQGGVRPVPDPRSAAQRTHDALDEVCHRLLRVGDVPASGGTPATLIITMSEDQLSAAAVGAALQADGVALSGPARVGRQANAVETSTGEVLSVAEALRLAAEAEIVPVVLAAGGRPLQLGRSRRCASTSQTYALIARDGGCSFPGCTVRPEWCERHHIVPWHRGGRTDVDNLTLLCGYHHAHFQQAGWTAALDADGLPAWRPPRWQDRHRQPLVNHRIRERHLVPGPRPVFRT